MSEPRGKSGDPYVGGTPYSDTQPPRQRFIMEVLDEDNPIMGEAFEAACRELGYEPHLPVVCDPEYMNAVKQYDRNLGELKALAAA